MYILYTILSKKSIVFLLFSNERLVCFLWLYGRELDVILKNVKKPHVRVGITWGY